MLNWRGSRFYIIYSIALCTLAAVGYYGGVYKPNAVHQKMHENRYFSTDLTFYDLPRITMNIKNQEKASRVNLDISLEVAKKDAWRLEDFQSRITDKIVAYMYQQDADEMRPPKDIAWLHKDLLNIVNTANQPVVVHDVIFRELVIM